MPKTKFILSLLGFASFLILAMTWYVPFINMREPLPLESFSIWADGTPRIGPFKVELNEGKMAIDLAHRLIFDGKKYYSELYFPITESYVIQRNENQYEWRNADGRIFLIEKKASYKNDEWSLKAHEGNRILICNRGISKSYIYDEGKLIQATEDGLLRSVYYVDGMTSRVLEIRDGIESSVNFVYDKNGFIEVLNCSGKALSIRRDSDGNLNRINDIIGVDIKFEYKNGLLTEVFSRGSVLKWTWGDIRIKHNNPRRPPPPIICADYAYIYEVTYEGNLIKVYWRQKGGQRRGCWEYLPLTGGLIARSF